MDWNSVSLEARRRTLGLLFSLALIYQFGYSVAAIHSLAHGTEIAREPMSFGFHMRAISGIEREALNAGLRWGDRVTEIGGRSFDSRGMFKDAVRTRKSGDSLEVRALHGSQPVHAFIKLAPEARQSVPALNWAAALAIHVLLPLFCLALGFWTVFLRAHDLRAWLLLGMLIGFSQFASDLQWSWPLRPAALVWHEITGETYGVWLVWLVLFAIYFPERASFDRRRPWIKWILIAPLLFQAGSVSIFHIGAEYSWDSIAWLRAVLDFEIATQAYTVSTMAAFSAFFFLLAYQRKTAQTADARRRIQTLHLGTGISLAPMAIAVAVSLALRSDPLYGIPEWAVLICLLALLLFPATLAYVIVIHRAMEVRMVLRTGAKYALARGGLRFARVVLGALAGTAIGMGFGVSGAPLWIRVVGVAAGVLFFLVRRTVMERVNQWIDRRFFREAYRAEQVLSELSEQARRCVETGPLLELVTQRISDTLHISRAAVFLKSGGEYSVAQALGNGAEPAALSARATTIELLSQGNRPALVYFDDPQSWVYRASEEERETLRHLDPQVLLPLAGREQLLGVMALGPKLSEEPYSRMDLQMLQSVAVQTGLALENSELVATVKTEAARRERVQRELEIAREVQERLFPGAYPAVPGVDYYGTCRPALAVGGDYYDFLPRTGRRLGIAIGDVSGKGIGAALMMASLQSLLRGQTAAGLDDLSRLITNINRLLYESSTSNRYVTFFYGEYDPATRRLAYVNAGHNEPIILRGDEVIRLPAGGPVVGLLSAAEYDSAECTLESGDLLLGFTDGISEAMTADYEEWGEDRLIDAARYHAATCPSARETVERLLADATEFTAGAEQNDDMTIVAVRVT